MRNRHQAGCRVAVERAVDRYTLICDGPVIALKGDSYRLKDRDLGRVPAAATEEP